MIASSDVPLCVDLDGTLIRTDSLVELIACLVRVHPGLLLLLPLWMLSGRARFKRKIAEHASLDAALLPYEERLMEWLRLQKASGRRLVLVTAADERVALHIAQSVGIFDEVMASDGVRNLKGGSKGSALVERFPGGFDYAGDSRADLKVWPLARQAIVVNASASTLRSVRRHANVTQVIARTNSHFRGWMRALRVHQCVKNVLVVMPVLTSHRMFEGAKLMQAGWAFLGFGFCASSAYLLNDLLDLESDRQHHRKRNRPFASGKASLLAGFLSVPLLLAAAAAVCLFLPARFALVLAAYFALTVLYSTFLKRKLLVDVFTLSTLYVLRIVGGGAATQIRLSSWLLAFSMFLFLSLAFSKRSTELHGLAGQSRIAVPGRGYLAEDLPLVAMCGVAAGFQAALVLTLYLDSDQVRILYAHPQILWLLLPMVLYWVSRVWIVTWRGRLDDDPILFALKDPITYLLAAAGAAVVILSAMDWRVVQHLGLP